MKAFVGLFRGINVGGRNILPMKELVSLMEGVGAKSVSTYIQSGNVVFQAVGGEESGLAAKIQDSIEERYSFRPELVILDEIAIESAIAGNPFAEADSAPNKVHLSFLSALPSNPDLDALERIRAPSERYELKGTVFYFHAPDGIGRSKLAARIERSLGVSGTGRNWRTVRKLQEMIQAAG